MSSDGESLGRITISESDYSTDCSLSPVYEGTSRNDEISDHYDILELIGKGKYGTVHRCRSKVSPSTSSSTEYRAVKRTTAARSLDGREGLEREAEIMRRLGTHPLIIRLYDAFINTDERRESFFVMELVEGGELFERIAGESFFLNEKSAAEIIRQICDAVEFVHANGIVHLDVKPENILCLSRTGNQIKLIDFGLAHYFDPVKGLHLIAGTPEFVAPEVISYDEIDFKSDMWSIGVITYILQLLAHFTALPRKPLHVGHQQLSTYQLCA